MQNINVQSKAKQTSLERYGETSHMKTEEYRAMFSGASNPAWKAEKTPSQREEDRSSVEYRSWRKAVFERDHFLCKRCGGRGDWKYGVHAHHILNWSDNEDVRYDVNNGVTLCASCHTLFHSIYGKRNNNVHQFNEFLSYGKKVC